MSVELSSVNKSPEKKNSFNFFGSDSLTSGHGKLQKFMGKNHGKS